MTFHLVTPPVTSIIIAAQSGALYFCSKEQQPARTHRGNYRCYLAPLANGVRVSAGLGATQTAARKQAATFSFSFLFLFFFFSFFFSSGGYIIFTLSIGHCFSLKRSHTHRRQLRSEALPRPRPRPRPRPQAAPSAAALIDQTAARRTQPPSSHHAHCAPAHPLTARW